MPPSDGSYGGGEFFRAITEAVRELMEEGFRSPAQLERLIAKVREAALRSLAPLHVVETALRDALEQTYRRQIGQGLILKRHPGVSRFTLDRVAPRLRGELDKRIMASSQLIKLNREKAVEDTLRRFSGWATSVPPGGSEVGDRREVKADIRKSLAQLPFVERRVAIDQGHKFASSLSQVLAVDAGAIAMRWKSHWRQTGYNYRPDHKERDGKIYVLRGSWALKQGLISTCDGYLDEMTQPAEEPFCRCFGVYLHALRDLPAEMLTDKGRAELERVRAELKR